MFFFITIKNVIVAAYDLAFFFWKNKLRLKIVFNRNEL